jgi:chromosome segregation protein
MLKDKQAEVDRSAADSQSVQDSFLLKEKSIEALKGQHLEKLAELTEHKNEIVKVEKELELIARRDAKLGAQLEQEKTLLQAKEEAVRSVENDLSEALRAKAAKDALIEDLRGSLEERQFAIERLRTWIEETRRARDEDRFKLQTLQKLEESRRAVAGPADVPEALGRLADLIETDPEYAAMVDAIWKEEAAVPVVPALDFLKRAAESEQDGRYLLVASRPGERPSPPAIQDPSVLGLLKSQLRVSPKIKDYLGQLREGVIVRDIKSAIELWLRHPALNFVTAKGDLLLSSGLLKLGRSEDGIFALGQEIKRLEERISRRDEELAPLVAEFEKKRQEKDHLEEDGRRESALLEELGERIHELEKRNIGEQAEREKTAGAVNLFTQEVEILRRDGETLGLNRDDLVRRIVALEEEERAWKARVETEENDAVMHRGKNIQEEKRFIELRADTTLIKERYQHMTGQVQELGERIEAVQKKTLAFREESQRAGKEEEEARGAVSDFMAKLHNLEEEKKAKQSELNQKEADLLKKHAADEEQDRRVAGLREELEKRKEERVKWEVAKAEVDRDLVNLEETCWQELKKTLHEVKNERPEIDLSDAEIEEQLAKTDEDLQRIKSVNLMAEEEYLSHKERYDFLIQQRDDLRQSIDATQEAIRTIDEESQTQFLNALAEVNKNFQEVFTLLFKGGSAEVRLLDDAFPQDSGVEIIAQPPGKKVQNIALLSGGEKSLTSLAFLFALFRFKPTPFCILDEVDAALDDVNLARFLDLMRNIQSETQFIIITHNYKTMEVADYIYGTTMAEPNITKLYSVKLEKQQELIS